MTRRLPIAAFYVAAVSFGIWLGNSLFNIVSR